MSIYKRLQGQHCGGYCNTPRGEFAPHSSHATILSSPSNPLTFFKVDPLAVEDVTTIDWFRATTNCLDDFHGLLSELRTHYGVLGCAGVRTQDLNKGFLGYLHSEALLLEVDGEIKQLGMIAYSEQNNNKGGLFELTGDGCSHFTQHYPELWYELYELLVTFHWRVTRLDIALDLLGEYALEQGITVPKLADAAENEDLFLSANAKGNIHAPSVETAGKGWAKMLFGRITPDTYHPLEHAPAGLTVYIGNRKSADDFFRCYEKGKQLLGSKAAPDAIDRAWVRIEHEMKRHSGRTIPIDAMIRPDHYFAANRPKVRAIMDALRHSLAKAQATEWQKAVVRKEKDLILSKKMHWAKHSYGRLFKTLVDTGIGGNNIVQWLSQSDGLKEFLFDIDRHTGKPPVSALRTAFSDLFDGARA